MREHVVSGEFSPAAETRLLWKLYLILVRIMKVFSLAAECMCYSLGCVWLFATPWTVAHQALLPMEFPRQEYWSGLLFSSPGDLPNPGIESRSPALWVDSLTSEPPGKPLLVRRDTNFSPVWVPGSVPSRTFFFQTQIVSSHLLISMVLNTQGVPSAHFPGALRLCCSILYEALSCEL